MNSFNKLATFAKSLLKDTRGDYSEASSSLSGTVKFIGAAAVGTGVVLGGVSAVNTHNHITNTTGSKVANVAGATASQVADIGSPLSATAAPQTN